MSTYRARDFGRQYACGSAKRKATEEKERRIHFI